MRKLKLQTQITLDGFMSAPDGNLNWMTWDWDDEIKQYVKELNTPIDTILLGRKMTSGFIDAWTSRIKTYEDEGELWFAKKMIDSRKIVFTKTVKISEWENTEVNNGDLTEEVNKLKNESGNEIIAYGGAGFVSSLVKHNLIDEYNLFINPVSIGKGISMFNEVKDKFSLKLINSRSFSCGIIAARYLPQSNNR